MKVGMVYGPIFLEHVTGSHPESPARLEAIITRLEETELISELTSIAPRPATRAELAAAHFEEYIGYIEEVNAKGGGWLDADTLMSLLSYQAALQAAGGSIRAAEAVMSGEVASAVALVRPPGHHAMPGKAMGFCIFNNIAVAARYLQRKKLAERILIVDFDVHHGNGTQEVFFRDGGIFYISTHQSHFYPGTGQIDEVGFGPGKGFNMNIPLPAGCGDREYEQVFRELIAPAATRFGPQIVLVSMGFDSHWKDPLASMRLSLSGILNLMAILNGLAADCCGGRIAGVLEGGYALDVLAGAIPQVFELLLGRTPGPDTLGSPPENESFPDITDTIALVKEAHNL
ncbi:histone deacetylase [Chloroflexota bacterium]